MEFRVDSADSLEISDAEISNLLIIVYVGGGYTDQATAHLLFEPAAVRQRGKIIGAREATAGSLAGMVIVVYPKSPAQRLAQGDETEMHLLAVAPEYRGQGLGKVLVTAAVDEATRGGYAKMVLATQATMGAAHRLYESSGFVRTPERDFSRAGRNFLVYEKVLA